MVGLIIISVAAVAFIIIVGLWVEGIDQMNKNHPDYKGEDLFGEEEPKKIK
jgi:predicted outer membrane lipoprotein